MLHLWSEIGEIKPNAKDNFLWYNKNILVQNKSIFYKDFFDLGIWYVQDLYTDDGVLVPFQVWTSRGLRKTNMIRWMGLVNKIHKVDKIYSDDVTALFVRISNDSCKSIATVKPSMVYQLCVESVFGNDVIVPKANKYVPLNQDNRWHYVYEKAHRIPMNVKLKEFQYLFLHDALVNGYWLYKWRIRETEICTICRNGMDNLKHAYWDCEFTQRFWADLKEWWVVKFGEIDLDIEDIFYGTEQELLCHLIFIAKQHIYVQRMQDKAPNIVCYTNIVDHVKRIEENIARKNNRGDAWLEKWILI